MEMNGRIYSDKRVKLFSAVVLILFLAALGLYYSQMAKAPMRRLDGSDIYTLVRKCYADGGHPQIFRDEDRTVVDFACLTDAELEATK